MAKKSLGYTELEWVCPTCHTRNPGSSRTCKGCGSPQPPDVEFVAPAAVHITKDDAVARQATAGPDIHCPYCDARNPAGATVCKQCGGDLTKAQARQAGQIVSNFSMSGPKTIKCPACGTENAADRTTCHNCGAPLPTVKPTPAPQPQKPGGISCLLIGVGALALLAIGIFILFSIGSGGEQTTSAGTVVDSHWTRSIQVLGLRPRQYTDWLDEIPADAEIRACHDEVREVVEEEVPNSVEVCGTPYAVDQGTGFAEVVQDCVYQVMAQQCEYTVNEWLPVDTLETQGSGANPVWPTLTRQQREGERSEHYECIIEANDQQFTYVPRSFNEYLACVPGTKWDIVTNERGRVLSAAPAQ